MNEIHDQIRRGRLDSTRTNDVSDFLSSSDADKRFADCDVRVDLAHVLMLTHQHLIDTESSKILVSKLLQYLTNGIPDAVFDPVYEDIHAGIEAQLIKDCGVDVGGKMHLGRSRNDEVATCIRMRTRIDIITILNQIIQLRKTLLDHANHHTESVMPGFTHFQHAQPTTLAHYLLSYESALYRDTKRLFDAYTRVNESPLGSAAFAGTGFELDRELVSKYLGFPVTMSNSMDGVAARDFVLEVQASLAILMSTISRICDELILWSSSFIQFIELDDNFCSTSSIMPQKKNPDTAELMRAKSSTVFGELIAGLTVMKAIPMSYNRDMQDLTPHLWRSIDTVESVLPLLSKMIQSAKFNTKRMADESIRGNTCATELADYLVRKFGLPFRSAHNIVGRSIKIGGISIDILEKAGLEICNISLKEKGLTQSEIDRVVSPLVIINSKCSYGSPNPDMMKSSISSALDAIKKDESSISALNKNLTDADTLIVSECKRMIS